jgi:hypothetical protein
MQQPFVDHVLQQLSAVSETSTHAQRLQLQQTQWLIMFVPVLALLCFLR